YLEGIVEQRKQRRLLMQITAHQLHAGGDNAALVAARLGDDIEGHGRAQVDDNGGRAKERMRAGGVGQPVGADLPRSRITDADADFFLIRQLKDRPGPGASREQVLDFFRRGGNDGADRGSLQRRIFGRNPGQLRAEPLPRVLQQPGRQRALEGRRAGGDDAKVRRRVSDVDAEEIHQPLNMKGGKNRCKPGGLCLHFPALVSALFSTVTSPARKRRVLPASVRSRSEPSSSMPAAVPENFFSPWRSETGRPRSESKRFQRSAKSFR